MNSEIKIKDEEILLIGLCRLEFSKEQIKKLMTLTGVVSDWYHFSSLANKHGVAALVYHNLKKYNLLKRTPEEVVAFLRGALMRSLGRNTFHSDAIVEVLRLFNKEKIRTVLLKGLALEISVYDNAGLRQMTDVDVLTSREQCMQAWKILLSNGFVSLPVKSIFHKLIITDMGKHLPSVIKNGTSVDIHHDLFGTKNNELTRVLFDSSYEVDIKGEKTYIPQSQIFFLYLVKHLYMHEMNNESQLRLYTDLVVMIEKHYDEIINYDLLTFASGAGMSEILAWRLELLRDLWGINFPEWINDFINRWSNPDSINKFFFFLRSPKDNPTPDKPKFYRGLINNIPGIHRKILFLTGDIFPSVTFMKKRYKCQRIWRVLFYYPHRLGKIFWLFRR